MSRHDKWITALILIILAACIPFELPKPPPDYSPCAPPPSPTPISSASPRPSCEAYAYEIDDLKSDLANAREIIKDFRCYCE